MYPIEICLSVYLRSTIWFDYLHYDAIYLHSLLWTTQAYFDWICHHETSEAVMVHMSKTLTLLKRRLSDSRLAVADTTIFVVVLLVTTSALFNDKPAAMRHMDGLYRMVTLRGGLGVLRENTQMRIEVCRYEIFLFRLLCRCSQTSRENLMGSTPTEKFRIHPNTNFTVGRSTSR